MTMAAADLAAPLPAAAGAAAAAAAAQFKAAWPLQARQLLLLLLHPTSLPMDQTDQRCT
jgi:hypothetical protein